MTADEFRRWQRHLGLKSGEVAVRLGKSGHTISRYRKFGVPDRESETVRLACSAIANGIQPWGRHSVSV